MKPNAARALAAAVWLAALITGVAAAEPANTLRELGARLRACVQGAASPDVDLTIVFSLRRDGALLGEPRITHAHLPDSADARRRAAEAVATAMQKCLPIPVTDALGGAIAGRPFTIRIVGRKRDTDV